MYRKFYSVTAALLLSAGVTAAAAAPPPPPAAPPVKAGTHSDRKQTPAKKASGSKKQKSNRNQKNIKRNQKRKVAFKVQQQSVKLTPEQSLYAKSYTLLPQYRSDHHLFQHWLAKKLPMPLEASDNVLVRRLYLDLLGRLPTVEEAKEYVSDTHKNKYLRLANKLVYSREFVTYWTMQWCDILRVKSEFPINLWPNAVYSYQRAVQQFLTRDSRVDHFFYKLLTSSGSNFRSPEANFLRAAANRTPQGIARSGMLTIFGIRFDTLPPEAQKNITAFFEDVKFKSTKEWKEEIVYVLPGPERTLTLPNGDKVKIPTGADARKYFANYAVFGKGRRLMAEAVVNRTWFWFFGRGIVPEGDDMFNRKPQIPAYFRALVNNFLASRCSFHALCLDIVGSAAYRSASWQPQQLAAMEANFAAYPIRRLGAEVLDDAIRDVTQIPSKYHSVIPEPFTFLPPEMRTIDIADGSISSSFLILFGRPARDSGLLSERNDTINIKQRLFLFNSGALFRKLNNVRNRDIIQRQPMEQQVEYFYWLFLSRPPTDAEMKLIKAEIKSRHKNRRWQFPQDMCWILINSAEFLHRH